MQKKQAIAETLCVIVFFCVLCVVLLNIISHANYYPAWDQAHHLSIANEYFKAIRHENIREIWFVFTNQKTIYPPLFHILIAFGYALFGQKEQISLYINLAFLFLLGISTYALSRAAGFKEAAPPSGIVVLIIPLFLNLSTDAMTDISSVALFITLYWTIFKSDYFKSTRWSTVSGVLLLCLILSRYAFFSAAIPMIIYGLVSIKRNGSRAIRNLIIVVACILPSLFWYSPHWTDINTVLKFYGDPNNYPVKLYHLPQMTHIRNWTYFLKASVQSEGIGLIPIIGFFLCILSRFYTRSKLEKYFFWSIATNFITQTIWLDKIPKYVSYSYPLIIIVTLSWAVNLKKYKNLYIGIITGSMLLNTTIAIIRFPDNTPVIKLYDTVHLLPGALFQYTHADWPLAKIVADIPTNTHKPSRVLILTDTQYLNRSTFNYYTIMQHKTFYLEEAVALYDPSKTAPVDVFRLKTYDYIFIKLFGDIGVFVNRGVTNEIYDVLQNSTDFSLFKSYPLPDNTYAWIYKNTQTPDSQ